MSGKQPVTSNNQDALVEILPEPLPLHVSKWSAKGQYEAKVSKALNRAQNILAAISLVLLVIMLPIFFSLIFTREKNPAVETKYVVGTYLFIVGTTLACFSYFFIVLSRFCCGGTASAGAAAFVLLFSAGSFCAGASVKMFNEEVPPGDGWKYGMSVFCMILHYLMALIWLVMSCFLFQHNKN